MNENIQYVLGIMIDPRTDRVVVLVKNRGPKDIVGKTNFPGGKIERGETPVQAVRRECREETTLDVPEDNWFQLGTVGGKGFTIHCFMAYVRGTIDQAISNDGEEVLVISINALLNSTQANPDQFPSHFRSFLVDALSITEEDFSS